tara:strand:- start:1139 stop:1621 length:483 start_codon:yes stop_codon:yes gene_type:complete
LTIKYPEIMASRKLNYIEIEEDFRLIGIHSQLEAYKLAFNLNKSLKVCLKKFEYKIEINKAEFIFEMFKHVSEIYNTKIYLFSNKSFANIKPIKLNLFENIDSKIYLIEEKKNIDFFLKIEGGNFNYSSLINKINKIALVQTCYLVNLKSQKSKYNLIFE